jgi:hypothetical protein
VSLGTVHYDRKNTNMKGFLLGLAVAAMGFGGYLYWTKQGGLDRAPDPRPGVTNGRPDEASAKKKKKKHGRGAARLARGGVSGAPPESVMPPPPVEPEPLRLSAADLRPVSQGDDLTRPDVIRMDLSKGETAAELSEEDIDGPFRAEEAAILDCISASRPDPETYVPGRVTVKFRIQQSGQVRGVRVEAPAILQKGGIYSCLRGVVGRLRCPPSGSSQVVTYPFTLS